MDHSVHRILKEYIISHSSEMSDVKIEGFFYLKEIMSCKIMSFKVKYKCPSSVSIMFILDKKVTTGYFETRCLNML